MAARVHLKRHHPGFPVKIERLQTPASRILLTPTGLEARKKAKKKYNRERMKEIREREKREPQPFLESTMLKVRSNNSGEKESTRCVLVISIRHSSRYPNLVPC